MADPCDRTKSPWPYTRVRPWSRHYLGWDQKTPCEAIIVLPTEWDQNNPPAQPVPLVISPHGRNNAGYANACHYWKEAPADGGFALISPDGLGRAHDAASDPYDQPPSNSGLFTYGYRRQIQDLGRMPAIVQAVLPWLAPKIDLERVYVLGSSMGGLEALLLAALYPDGVLAGGTGRLQGSAAYDAPCDLETQCAYLTHMAPATAALMLEEIGSEPLNRQGWNDDALFYSAKHGHVTIRDLLKTLPNDQVPWDDRSPMTKVSALAALAFPLKIYWSSADIVVGHQATDQSGKLANELQGAPTVESFSGTWAHSTEFEYGSAGDRLTEALKSFNLIQ